MKSYTNAYTLFAKQIEDTYDFSLLTSYAIPSLRKHIKSIANNVPIRKAVKPDFYRFDKSDSNRISSFILVYENHLSSYFLISVFSFFEAYIKNAIGELIKFHGGVSKWSERVKDNINESRIRLKKEGILAYEGSLKEPLKENKKGKYRDRINLLLKNNYKFPSDKLAPYGIIELVSKFENLRASELLPFLIKVFDIPLGYKELEEFKKIRRTRNDIAHGKKISISLRMARKSAKSLRSIALKIDNFLVNNFFIIEYVP